MVFLFFLFPVLLLSFVRLWYLSLSGRARDYENCGSVLGMGLDDSVGRSGVAEFELHADARAAQGGRVTAI